MEILHLIVQHADIQTNVIYYYKNEAGIAQLEKIVRDTVKEAP